MTKAMKYFGLGCGGLLLIGVSAVVYQGWKIRDTRGKYLALTRGMSATEVEKRLGRPDEIRHGERLWLDYVFWDDDVIGPATGKVSYEYVYILSRLYVGRSLVLGFDAEGKLVSKHEVD